MSRRCGCDAMRTLKKLLTAEELLCLPKNRRRLELVEGTLHKMPLAGGRHGRVAMKIGSLLDVHAESTGLGQVFAAETGFILRRGPDTVRAPDASFVARSRLLEEGPPDGYLELAPDLAVEVVSPNDRPREVQEKVEDWLNAGVRQLWLAQPSGRTVTVYRAPEDWLELREDDALEGGDALPGFTCRVGELFK